MKQWNFENCLDLPTSGGVLYCVASFCANHISARVCVCVLWMSFHFSNTRRIALLGWWHFRSSANFNKPWIRGLILNQGRQTCCGGMREWGKTGCCYFSATSLCLFLKYILKFLIKSTLSIVKYGGLVILLAIRQLHCTIQPYRVAACCRLRHRRIFHKQR